jgi:L-ascorbate metabolism protein UlaG (beta-lactamase superfamily)
MVGRKVSWAAIGVAALAAAAAVPRTWNDPAYFDGHRFHQPEPLTTGFRDWARRTATSRRGPWRDFTNTPPGPPPPVCVTDGRLRVTFVNHATFLIQMDGVNILTDPTWAGRSVAVVGPRRHRPPGLRFDDLPPIDAVLVSHNHQDHMDLPTLIRLQSAWRPAIYTGTGNARFLARQGVAGARDLNWWQSATIAPGVILTAVPARHSSGRGLLDGDRTLWCGFVIEGPSGSIYFAGDTGMGAHFAAIGAHFPNLRLALLPISGSLPVWYMRERHLGPETAVEAFRELGAATGVPMHFGTFPNGDDAELQPAAVLRQVLAAAPDVAPHWVILDNGESLNVPAVGAASPLGRPGGSPISSAAGAPPS